MYCVYGVYRRPREGGGGERETLGHSAPSVHCGEREREREKGGVQTRGRGAYSAHWGRRLEVKEANTPAGFRLVSLPKRGKKKHREQKGLEWVRVGCGEVRVCIDGGVRARMHAKGTCMYPPPHMTWHACKGNMQRLSRTCKDLSSLPPNPSHFLSS